MKKWFCILIPVLVLMGLIGWRIEQKRSERKSEAEARGMRSKAPASVATALVQIRDIEQVFTVTGNVEAPLNVKIATKITGRVEYLEVREGARIHKGQVLVRIDPSEIEAQVRQQQANVAEARYRLAQAQLTQSPATVAVSMQLRQQKAAVASALADYNQEVKNYEAQMAAAKASITEASGKVESAVAVIENARAAIKSAKANLLNARTKYERQQSLLKKGFVSAQSVDDARAVVAVQESAVEIAEGQLKSAIALHNAALAQKQAQEEQAKIVKEKGTADIEAAKARLEQARASVEYAAANQVQTSAYKQSLAALQASVDAASAGLRSAQARRADTVLKSPLDGFVTARYVDPGAVVTAGQPALAVQFMNQVWISVAVPEEIVAKLHIGQPARAELDAFPSRQFIGSIIQINPSADAQSRQFTVRVIFDNQHNLLKPGMFARVSLVTERTPKTVVVPREAVQRDREGQYLAVVMPDGKVQRRPVEPGASDSDYFAIPKGVRPGERVVTISTVPLRDGMQVKIDGKKGSRGGGRKRK